MLRPDVLDMVQVQGQVHSGRTSNLLKRRCGRTAPPWNFTAFWLTCKIAGAAAACAPAAIASACSSVMTLKAATPMCAWTA
jgi:hypothetical protein